MGYACPVCEIPQADARHLANHLAFTALLGREDHRAWLDEHAPGWSDMDERALAERVEREAKEVEFPQVFEDTAGGLDGEHDHDHEPAEERSGALFDDKADLPGGGNDGVHGHGRRADAGGGRSGPDAAPIDEEAQRILEEAREMTRQMVSEADEQVESTDDDAAGDDATDGDEPADADDDVS